MVGIAVGWLCDVTALHIAIVFIFSALMLSLTVLRFAPKWLFGIGAMLFMLSVGLFAENRQAVEKTPQWSCEKHEYKARLVEVPALRGTNVKVLAELTLCNEFLLENVRAKGLVYLYFPRTVDTEGLLAGDLISLETTVNSVRNQGNPAEFDIENYYYIKNITGTAFVPDGKWEKLQPERKGLQITALALRAKVIALYEKLGFEDDALALLSALTLGEKRDFPQELKENYSVAGASHILALSGLHLGVLYMLLTSLIPARGRKLFYRLLRELLILFVLWGFAFVAGLPPSVVRSATLFTLISLGVLLGRDVSPISSLSFAAIVMLLFSPHLLFDVSFQLSFAAVFSILLLVPPLQQLLGVYKHGLLYGYLVNLLVLSLVAQVSTLPFVWYYFGVFPIYFLLTNLLVVPMAFVVMFLTVVLWVLSPIVFLQQLVAFPLMLVVKIMNTGVKAVAALPGASIALPPLDAWGVVCVALLLLLFLVALIQRRWWWLALTLSSLLLFVVYCFMSKSEDESDYMIVYNNRKNPLLHLVYDSGENYLVSTVPQLDAEYEYASTPYVKREALSAPQWVSWGYSDSLVCYNDGLFVFDGLTVKMLDNAHWVDTEKAEPVDILILCRGFLGRIKKLVNIYPAKCVVLDGSLYKRSRNRIIREYSQLGIEVVDISQIGAVKIISTVNGFEMLPMRGK